MPFATWLVGSLGCSSRFLYGSFRQFPGVPVGKVGMRRGGEGESARGDLVASAEPGQPYGLPSVAHVRRLGNAIAYRALAKACRNQARGAAQEALQTVEARALERAGGWRASRSR